MGFERVSYKMRSAFWIVERRCAITKVVCCFMERSRACTTTSSLSASKADVASASRHTFSLSEIDVQRFSLVSVSSISCISCHVP